MQCKRSYGTIDWRRERWSAEQNAREAIAKGAPKKMADVKGYFISTCGWCKKTKNFLDENEVEYEYEYVDLLTGDDRERALSEVSEYNPRKSFPTVVVRSNGDTEVVIGFKEDELREALGL
jgi:glutaredoxin-like protein NrdH